MQLVEFLRLQDSLRVYGIILCNEDSKYCPRLISTSLFDKLKDVTGTYLVYENAWKYYYQKIDEVPPSSYIRLSNKDEIVRKTKWGRNYLAIVYGNKWYLLNKYPPQKNNEER